MKRSSVLRGLILAALLVASIVSLVQVEPVKAQQPVHQTAFNPKVDEYTVRSGDTLWTIADKVVGSPWLWPKIWAYNPEIANPNWIYPGDTIYFYERDFVFPSLYGRPQLASRALEVGKDEVDSDPLAEEPVVQVVQTLTKDRQTSGQRLVNMFVTERQLQEAGTLVNAADDDILLSLNDIVYLKFPPDELPNRGDEFMLYRTVQKIEHPIRNETFGFITEVTGFARITAVQEDGIVVAKITDAHLEIERGHLATPKTSNLRSSVESKRATASVDGVVIGVHSGWGVVGSELQLAFIDLGSESGIERGNEFVVYRESDPIRDAGRGNDLPLRPIGLLRAVDVKDKAATVLIVDSREEIGPGQRIRTVTQ